MKTLIALVISIIIFGILSSYVVGFTHLKGEVASFLHLVVFLLLIFRFHRNVRSLVD